MVRLESSDSVFFGANSSNPDAAASAIGGVHLAHPCDNWSARRRLHHPIELVGCGT
jgi:hypothetical protein